MKVKHLEAMLSDVAPFAKPKVMLEQYPTSAHIASHILFTAQEQFQSTLWTWPKKREVSGVLINIVPEDLWVIAASNTHIEPGLRKTEPGFAESVWFRLISPDSDFFAHSLDGLGLGFGVILLVFV